MIRVLPKETIEQIAAGEVVERPMSVVKELVENAIDAGATAVSVEIVNGGIDLIRVTDNGSGFDPEEIPTAFLPHATSKIRSIEDLEHVRSLGFRGEALPSIASVSETEVISRREEDGAAVSHVRRANEFVSEETIGAPVGTTVFVRNLFFNTPARRKFLKTPVTEASYVTDVVEKIALSHPELRLKYVVNHQEKLSTPGTGELSDAIYSVFGRETAKEIMTFSETFDDITVSGAAGKPVISKGNRSFEIYFVNGRYVKNRVIESALEDAYQAFMMQHRYPFAVFHVNMPESEFDCNVHPAKMEIRFLKEGAVYQAVLQSFKNALYRKEFSVEGKLSEEPKKPEKEVKYASPEPFETRKEEKYTAPSPVKSEPIMEKPRYEAGSADFPKDGHGPDVASKPEEAHPSKEPLPEEKKPEQETFLHAIGSKKFRLVGQVFETYWLIETEGVLYIMDQHAAHEKVLYERNLKKYREKKMTSQMLLVPVVVTLSPVESELVRKRPELFTSIGFEINDYGGRDFALSAVPNDVYDLPVRELFQELVSSLTESYVRPEPELVLSRLATASCKAAVKGNMRLTNEEAESLLNELLTLENPYACPH
ncbi:MAG: DNA mismatch repair endonuclease MutL, partial [Lachnospiraceae bacterium]|nr:DNA mismatch repair endonuclease MutL [Lachnospiraceae bacterium]